MTYYASIHSGRRFLALINAIFRVEQNITYSLRSLIIAVVYNWLPFHEDLRSDGWAWLAVGIGVCSRDRQVTTTTQICPMGFGQRGALVWGVIYPIPIICNTWVNYVVVFNLCLPSEVFMDTVWTVGLTVIDLTRWRRLMLLVLSDRAIKMLQLTYAKHIKAINLLSAQDYYLRHWTQDLLEGCASRKNLY